jgi:hypothetical protein
MMTLKMSGGFTVQIITAVVMLCATACHTHYQVPTEGVTDFVVTDAHLEPLVRNAAEDWAANGLEIANFITINSNEHGVPVRFTTRDQLRFKCIPDRDKAKATDPRYADACTAYSKNDFEAIWISDDLTPSRLAQVIKHEIIHVLVPTATHIEDDTAHAVFHANSTSARVTSDDMNHLAAFTVCNEVEPSPEPRLAPVLNAH